MANSTRAQSPQFVQLFEDSFVARRSQFHNQRVYFVTRYIFFAADIKPSHLIVASRLLLHELKRSMNMKIEMMGRYRNEKIG